MNRSIFFLALLAVILNACQSSSGKPDVNQKMKNQEEEPIFRFVKTIFSPQVQKATPAAYINWVDNPENGLISTKDIGNYSFKLQYKPVEYLVIKELKDIHPQHTEFDTLKSAYKNLNYFNFSIKGQKDILKENIYSYDDYDRRVQYFAFKMQEDLMLVDGSDSLRPVFFHFERDYALSPELRFVLAFPPSKTRSGKDKILIFNDKILGTGRVKLGISAADLDRIPQLTF